MKIKNMANEINSAFENLHPQLKVHFIEIEAGKYEFEIELYDKQGKFQKGSSGEQVFSHLEDERFLNMVKGASKGLALLLADKKDITPIIDGPFELIIEHVLTNKSLSTIDDFAAKLDSVSAREDLMVQEYIYKVIKEIGTTIENFSENENSLSIIGRFQLSLSLPQMVELGEAIKKLVQNQKAWPLLVHWIKEWAGASQWSMNEAWVGGPLIEELLAYGTFIMMEREVDPNNKPEWWADLYIMVDLCLDINMDDLNQSGFLTESNLIK
jgi:hypothetical protein